VAGLRAVDRMVEGTGAFDAFRTHLLGDLEGLLLEHRDEIVQESPERAVRLGLRAVLGVMDAGVEPEGASEEEAREVLVHECRELLLSYLTGRARGGGDAAEVDFFDVWG